MENQEVEVRERKFTFFQKESQIEPSVSKAFLF